MTIEAARTADGSEPVEVYLSELMRLADIDGRRGDRSRNRLADIAVRFADLAITGELKIPTQLRWDLRDGIGEVKAGDVRILFYRPEASIHDRTVLRLTNGFDKRGNNTPRRQLDKAGWVRREDQQWPQSMSS